MHHGKRLAACWVLAVVFCLAMASVQADLDWTPVDQALQGQIAIGAFPGCVAIVANQNVLYAKAFGNFTYGDPVPMSGNNPPMQMDTLFDMASCTKVLATTTAAARLYQQGLLDLDMRVADSRLLGPDFAANGKGDITVRNLLLHNAGFPPDPDPFYSTPSFGCPATHEPQPPEVFSCRARIYTALLKQGLAYPTGSQYIYSDLSMITMMFVVGRVAMTHRLVQPTDLLADCAAADPLGIEQCYYEAYVRLHVIGPLKLPRTGFLPPPAMWAQAAPTENDTSYLHRQIQGQVSDGNAYALGGVAGHAGLFSTAPDALLIMQRHLFAADDDPYLNRTTATLFRTEYNASQSSRALGWNTNDPRVDDQGWNQSCGVRLSPRTFMHTGYTGTQVCGDPDNKIITILLTNRVYPTDANIKIREARHIFANAVADVLGLQPIPPESVLAPMPDRFPA